MYKVVSHYFGQSVPVDVSEFEPGMAFLTVEYAMAMLKRGYSVTVFYNDKLIWEDGENKNG